MTDKPIVWLGSSLADVRAFPDLARVRAGYELGLVQQGLDPTDWKPMAEVGLGVREIRVHSAREHRVIYVARFADVVYVLHAFEKKTGKTRRADIAIARQRLRRLVQHDKR